MEQQSVRRRGRRKAQRGFTLVEIIIAITLLVVGVLGVATMFGTGYKNVGDSARTTMAVTAARQMLEDIRLVPFTDLPKLDKFRTDTLKSLPDSGIQRSIARKWRYALAGTDAANAWSFSSDEQKQWGQLLSGTSGGSLFGAVGQIAVTSFNGPPVTLLQVTVTVSESRPDGTIGKPYITLQTLISRP